MHLLATTPGDHPGDSASPGPPQNPGEILMLSAQDSSLALLARAVTTLPEDYPSIRMLNLACLTRRSELERYLERMLPDTRLVVASLLGGEGYWPHVLGRLQQATRERPSLRLAAVPGDDRPDRRLTEASNIAAEDLYRIWRYLREGGPHNAKALLHFIARRFFDRPMEYEEPRILPQAFVHHPRAVPFSPERWLREGLWRAGRPVAAVLFYRSQVQSGDTQAFDELIKVMGEEGINPLPVAISSLRDGHCMELLGHLCQQARVQLVLNTTGFAAGGDQGRPLDLLPPVPVLQLILAASPRKAWQANPQGLRMRDIAMNIALPEMDGRIIGRAVAFKELKEASQRTQSQVMGFALDEERARFSARLGRNWIRLRELPPGRRHIALILANYPSRDSRIGNGVGLDSPASVVRLLHAMQREGYQVENIPASGDALLGRLLEGAGNDPRTRLLRPCRQSLALEDYDRHFQALPAPAQQAVRERSPACGWAPALSASSRHEAMEWIWKPTTMTLTCRRPMAIWPSTSGCGKCLACMPWFMWASTATWSGCRARGWPCHPPAGPRRPWALFPTCTPSSSTTPAKVRRPSAAPRP